jgi:AbiV family abortive infection protein
MASEELIKALLIRIYAETGKRPIKGFDKLFYKHQEKHSQIISTVLILFADKMDRRSRDENAAILIFLALAVAVLAYSQSLMEKGDRNILNLEENRQAGLYLDFHKVKNEWLSPDKEIDKESFLEYHEQISTFFDEIEKKYFSVNSSKALFQLYDSIQEIERNKI